VTPDCCFFFGEALVRHIQKLATGGRVETSNLDNGVWIREPEKACWNKWLYAPEIF